MDRAGMMQSQCCGRDAFQLHERRPEASRHIPLLAGRRRVGLPPLPLFMADFTVMQVTRSGPNNKTSLSLKSCPKASPTTEPQTLASDHRDKDIGDGFRLSTCRPRLRHHRQLLSERSSTRNLRHHSAPLLRLTACRRRIRRFHPTARAKMNQKRLCRMRRRT